MITVYDIKDKQFIYDGTSFLVDSVSKDLSIFAGTQRISFWRGYQYNRVEQPAKTPVTSDILVTTPDGSTHLFKKPETSRTFTVTIMA